MVSVNAARITTIVIAVVLLLISLLAFGTLFDSADNGWDSATIYSLVVAVLAILCIIFGIVGAVMMKRILLLVYTVFCGVFVLLWLVSAIWYGFSLDWYGLVASLLALTFWGIACYCAFTLWKVAHH